MQEISYDPFEIFHTFSRLRRVGDQHRRGRGLRQLGKGHQDDHYRANHGARHGAGFVIDDNDDDATNQPVRCESGPRPAKALVRFGALRTRSIHAANDRLDAGWPDQGGTSTGNKYIFLL
jgi:hypothetical protein